MGFVRIDHVGLVAYTIEQARQVLGEVLGLELDEPPANWPDRLRTSRRSRPTTTSSRVGEGETQVEVLIPEVGATSGAGPASSRERGPGLHHLCYVCDDVHAEAERLSGAGGSSEIAWPRTADGRRTVAFFHPRSTGGVLTELVPLRRGGYHPPGGPAGPGPDRRSLVSAASPPVAWPAHEPRHRTAPGRQAAAARALRARPHQ